MRESLYQTPVARPSMTDPEMATVAESQEICGIVGAAGSYGLNVMWKPMAESPTGFAYWMRITIIQKCFRNLHANQPPI
jgi:hypothetical protein